jgi:hypothetical protein
MPKKETDFQNLKLKSKKQTILIDFVAGEEDAEYLDEYLLKVKKRAKKQVKAKFKTRNLQLLLEIATEF